MCVFLEQEKIPDVDICIFTPIYDWDVLNLSYGRMHWQYFQLSGTAVLTGCSSNGDARIERAVVF